MHARVCVVGFVIGWVAVCGWGYHGSWVGEVVV